MFYLPIYIESRSGHEKRLLKQAQSKIEKLETEVGGAITNRLKSQHLDLEHSNAGFYWGPTRAVGWVKIERAVGGFSFHVAISTVGRGRNSRKEFVPLPYELQPNQLKHIRFDPNADSDGIIARFDEVFAEIVRSHKTFKDGYVDSTPIRENAKFINWKAMLETPFEPVANDASGGL